VSAIATTARPAAPASALASVATITGRNLRRLVRVPTLIAFATVQPVLFVLLFTYVFGGAVQPPGVARYIDYLLPGLFVLAIGFGASQTGVAIADDLASGMIDRFRSLPIASAAVLAGRVAADAVRNLFVVALMIAVASAIGFRFHAGPAAALAAVALAVAVGIAFSWLNLLLGLLVRNPESAGLAGLFPVIILVFTSSSLVPVATMPGWLQAFANVNRSPPSSMRCAHSALAAPPRCPCSKRSPGSPGSSSPPSPPRSSATDTRPRNAATDVGGTRKRYD
jgi:ABC transporter DrrB family efflux protein